MKHALRRVLFAAVAVAAALLLLEAGARVVVRGAVLGSIPAEKVKGHVLQANGDLTYDPVLGWKRTDLPNPGLGLDQNGFRHAAVARDKPPGVVRGFALGDSQTYGAGVEPDEAYPAVAERLLRARGLNVELINTGISGYTSRQLLRLIEAQLLAFDPDFLVIDARAHDDARDERPPTGGGVSATLARALFYSRLYRGARLVVDQASARPRMGGIDASRPLTDAERATQGNHDAILQLGLERGIAVWFLDYPFQDAPVRALAPASLLPAEARVVDTVGPMRASGLDAAALFLDNNHLTAAGNALVATALADTLAPHLSTLP